MEGHIGDEKEDKPRSQNKRLRELSGHCRALVTRVHTRNCNHFLRTCQAWGSFKKHIQFSRTTYVSHIVQKCTFPVHSNRTERLELFAPPQLLRIFQFTCFILIVNYCTKQKKTLYVNHLQLLWAMIYILSWTIKKSQKHFSGNYIQS